MSTISNRFMVTAIEDGTTLHGTLIATKSLAQSYNNGSCNPDWSVPANQPVIYVSLYDSVSPVAPDATFKWFWNGTELVFGANNKTADGRFEKTTYTSGDVTVPALRITDNLASSDNLNVDIIRFEGSRTISTAPIPFSCSVEVRITEWVSGGYLGTLSFADNAVIDNSHSSVEIVPTLYNDSGVVATADYAVAWYINEALVNGSTAAGSSVGSDYHLTVVEEDITDYATVKCIFTSGGSVVWTEYIGIDDTTDPEFMYIQQSTGDGNAASLRDGQSVTFRIWVNRMDDPSLDPDSPWEIFKVLLLNSTGQPYTGSITGLPVDQDGYRDITVTEGGESQKYGEITITYQLVTNLGKSLTGIVRAE